MPAPPREPTDRFFTGCLHAGKSRALQPKAKRGPLLLAAILAVLAVAGTTAFGAIPEDTFFPTYRKFRHASVYPGIDLALYGNPRQPGYDFIVHPGAGLARIRDLDANGIMDPADAIYILQELSEIR